MGTGNDGTTTPIGGMTRENWGNDKWVGGVLLEEVLLKYLPQAQFVLELGSGWTTIVLSREVARRSFIQGANLEVAALEHMPEWFDKVIQQALYVNVIHSPLTYYAPEHDGAGYEWYAVFPVGPYDLLLVDGPPRSSLGGRYGALPVLANHLLPGCIIILDDATPETAIVKGWMHEFGCKIVEYRHGPLSEHGENVLVLEYPGPGQVEEVRGGKETNV